MTSGSGRVVLFTCDRGFIVPTLVAAGQVAGQRRQADDFDILVLVIGFGPDELADLRAVCAERAIAVEPMELDLAAQDDGLHFEQSHVPISAMARLCSSAYLAKRHQHVLYVDGDVQVRGDIAPLLSYEVPRGRILAAPDRYIVSKAALGYSGRLWQAARSYLDGLRIEDPATYFNSGVLAARKDDWVAICADALAFYRENSRLCLFHDQSALNAVSQGRREVMSPRYNYITPFASAMGLDAWDPAIVHFTGSDKPWLFDDRAPWGGGFSPPYRDILKRHPSLLHYAQGWSRKRAEMAGPPKPRPMSARLSNAWLDIRRRGRFARYMTRQSFAF